MNDAGNGTEELVTPFRDFLERRLAADQQRELLAKGGWDEDLMSELRKLGWCDLARPEADGGLGVPLGLLSGLAGLVGEWLLPGPLLEQLTLGSLLSGRAPADGRLLALADPGVTLDWAAETGAFTFAGGRLDGTSALVRHAAHTDALLFVAQSPDGPALLWLPADDPALSVAEIRSDDPAATYARVTVTGRAIGAGELIVEGAGAAALLLRIRAWMRLLTACELAGVARRVLDDSVAHARQREQFGRPIGSFQAVKHLLAGMAQASLSMDALCAAAVAEAAAAEDAGDLAGLEEQGWAAKACTAQSARSVAEDGLQVHGGIGFTTEYDLHHYLRRAMALRGWYGDERELAVRLGSRRLAPEASVAR